MVAAVLNDEGNLESQLAGSEEMRTRILATSGLVKILNTGCQAQFRYQQSAHVRFSGLKRPSIDRLREDLIIYHRQLVVLSMNNANVHRVARHSAVM